MKAARGATATACGGRCRRLRRMDGGAGAWWEGGSAGEARPPPRDRASPAGRQRGAWPAGAGPQRRACCWRGRPLLRAIGEWVGGGATHFFSSRTPSPPTSCPAAAAPHRASTASSTSTDSSSGRSGARDQDECETHGSPRALRQKAGEREAAHQGRRLGGRGGAGAMRGGGGHRARCSAAARAAPLAGVIVSCLRAWRGCPGRAAPRPSCRPPIAAPPRPLTSLRRASFSAPVTT